MLFEQIKTHTSERKNAFFLDLAKSSMLSPEHVRFGTYVLYGTGDGRDVLSGLLLRFHGVQLIQAHNWYVAGQQEETFMQIHGSALARMHWPLSPPDFFLARGSALSTNTLPKQQT